MASPPTSDSEGSPSNNSSSSSNSELLVHMPELHASLEYTTEWGPNDDEWLVEEIGKISRSVDGTISSSFMDSVPYFIGYAKNNGRRPPSADLCNNIKNRIMVLRKRYNAWLNFISLPGVEFIERKRRTVTYHAYWMREERETALHWYFRTMGFPGYRHLRMFFTVKNAPLYPEERQG